jgi:ssDNA-binding Zn-finger/Zn-ribbon topoisomerase 1
MTVMCPKCRIVADIKVSDEPWDRTKDKTIKELRCPECDGLVKKWKVRECPKCGALMSEGSLEILWD